MKEVWLAIKDYENRYEVSNLGEVCTIWKEERVLIEQIDGPADYLYVRLWDGDAYHTFLVHMLVLAAFVANENNARYGDHISNDISDNKVSNLKWGSQLRITATTRDQIVALSKLVVAVPTIAKRHRLSERQVDHIIEKEVARTQKLKDKVTQRRKELE